MMTLSSAHFYLQLNGTISWPFTSAHEVHWVIRADFCGATIELSLGGHVVLQTEWSGMILGRSSSQHLAARTIISDADYDVETTNNMSCSACAARVKTVTFYKSSHLFVRPGHFHSWTWFFLSSVYFPRDGGRNEWRDGGLKGSLCRRPYVQEVDRQHISMIDEEQRD